MIDWTAVAAVLTAFAALATALIWPIAIFATACLFKSEIKAVAVRLPTLMDRVQTLKLGSIEAQLQHVAEHAKKSKNDSAGDVTPLQVQTAVKIMEEAGDTAGYELALRMDRLAREYELLRRTMPAGPRRTRSMTAVLVQMRALGPAVASSIENFKVSGSPGSRLAAIAIMQMQPELIDLDWLVERFRSDRPFVFYHAALALQNAAHDASPQVLKAIQDAAQTALDIINAYDGTPDTETVDILTELNR